MRRPRIHSCAVAAVVAGVALAGCGGGDDTTDAEPVTTTEAATALSKEELLAQGDAICAEVNAAVGTVGSTSSGADAQASQVAELYGGMVERLKGLGPPSDESAGYEELIGAADQLAQAQSDVALAAERGEDAALVSAESEASSAVSSFRSAADAFGFAQCSEAPSAPAPGGAAEAAGGSEEEAAPVPEEEAAPEVEEEEAAPETGGAGSAEEESAGGGASPGGGAESGSGTGGNSGGIGPG